VEDCAEIMLRIATTHLQGNAHPETIYFVLFDDTAKDVFDHTWQKLQTEFAPGAAGAKGA